MQPFLSFLLSPYSALFVEKQQNMAQLNDTATVNVDINSSRAEKELQKLKKKADELRVSLDKATDMRDTSGIKRIRSELAKTNRDIDKMQASAKAVENVMSHLDKAAPRELRQALRMLTKELNDIERGGKAWDEHTAKIRKVKDQLQSVNSELRSQEGFFTRWNRRLNDWQTTLTAGLATFTGLVLSGKQAVQTYADMDSAMADAQKFTGMTREEVEALNEEFKKMDTRSSREELNRLAGEAGMLGKNTQEDVMGYVRAADQINVALDDIGEGATETLSKLTNIFGDEQRLGTERSLLAVGSVINDLSQNSTAASSYLAEFGQRMAGVGAQADMTIPQIMAYAAVLDSQGQNVEMASTALSQLIMKLFQEPQRIAQATGLELDKLNEALNTSTNDALLMLLQRLHELGGMDVLAPIFQEMGTDGARASQVIAALAGNIETVVWQQENATKAYNEATSVTKEYNVQNNTVQAGLDKAKKGFTEMAVVLGEKLEPVMKYAISSTSALMRAISAIIEFVEEYWRWIVTCAAAVSAYTVAVNLAIIKEKIWIALKAVGKAAVYAWTVATQGAAVVTALFSGNLHKAGQEFKIFSALLKTNPLGLLFAAITAVVTGLALWAARSDEMSKANDRLAKSVANCHAEMMEENDKIDRMFERLKKAKKGTDEYAAAKDEILSRYGQYLKGLGQEIESLENVAGAYNAVKKAAEESAKARAAASARSEAFTTYGDNTKNLFSTLRRMLGNRAKIDKSIDADAIIERITTGLSDSGTIPEDIINRFPEFGGMMELDGIRYVLDKIQEQYDVLHTSLGNIDTTFGVQSVTSANFSEMTTAQLEANIRTLEKVQARIKDTGKAVSTELYNYGKLVKVNIGSFDEATVSLSNYRKELQARKSAPVTNSDNENDNGSGMSAGGAGGGSPQPDRLKELQQWYEQQKTLAAASYTSGETDYQAYLDTLERLQTEYLQKVSNDNAVSLKDRTDAALQLAEQARKQKEQADKDALQRQYADETAMLKQRLADDEITETAYRQLSFQAEIGYLTKQKALYADGSQERADLQRQIDDKLLDDRLEKRREFERKYGEAVKEYSQKSAEERKEAELAALDGLLEQKIIKQEEYEKAKKAIEERGNKGTTFAARIIGTGGNLETERFENDLSKLREELNEGKITAEEYDEAVAALKKNLAKESLQGVSRMFMDMIDSWEMFIEALKNGNPEEWLINLGNALSSTMSLMTAVFSQVTQLTQANADLQIAKIEKRYEAEIEAAKGNSEKIERLEAARDEEIAKVKAEASRKQFALQIATTIAQMAQNIVYAVGAGLQAGFPAALWMIPTLTALAATMGAIQLATIKKQQQAAAVQGYSEGGFTRPGGKDKPAGIVHAGEWVASQRLLASPVARPLIEALDYAQRNNTIGSLRMGDLNMSAPAASSPASSPAATAQIQQLAATNAMLMGAIAKLNRRLNEPFVTVNTVTGDTGIKKAQTDYERLMRNKTPKSKWK